MNAGHIAFFPATLHTRQNTFQMFVASPVVKNSCCNLIFMLVTHHHCPSCYSQIDHQIQKGGMEYWTLDTTGFDSLWRWGYTEPQALGQPTLCAWGNGNWAWCQGSGFPLHKHQQVRKRRGWRHAMEDTLHKGLYCALSPPIYSILGWDSEAPVSLNHSCRDWGHQVGYHKGHSWPARGFHWGPSQLGLGVNRVSRGRFILVTEGAWPTINWLSG